VQEATLTAPTEEEVARAQSETLNSFVFNFASTNAQMQRVLIYALLGLPDVRTPAKTLKQTPKRLFSSASCLLVFAHLKEGQAAVLPVPPMTKLGDLGGEAGRCSPPMQDYLFTYKAGIEAVTAGDILAAAQRHLHPGQQTVVMAADAEAFTRQLEEGGRRVLPMAVD
jgi:hypothetical protein